MVRGRVGARSASPEQRTARERREQKAARLCLPRALRHTASAERAECHSTCRQRGAHACGGVDRCRRSHPLLSLPHMYIPDGKKRSKTDSAATCV